MNLAFTRTLAAASTALLLATPAMAQDEAEKKAWSGETALGYVTTSGNTNNTNLNFQQTVKYESGKIRDTFVASGSNTQTTAANGDDVRTGERYFASNQLDYLFSERTYGLFRVTWQKDRFNGFDRQMTYLLGAGHQFIKTDSVSLKFEIGAGQRDDEFDNGILIDGESGNSEGIAYFADEFIWKFSEPAEFGQTLSVEYGSNNTVSRFTTYLKSQLLANVSVKVAYEMKRNSEVPSGTRNSDRTTTVAVAYTF